MGRVEPTAVERRTSDFVAVCTSDSRVSELQSFFVVSSLSFPSTLPARALRLSFFACPQAKKRKKLLVPKQMKEKSSFHPFYLTKTE